MTSVIPSIYRPKNGSAEHYWRIRATLPERYGQPCELLACGKMNSILIRFADGERHVANRYAIRRLKP